MCTSVRQTSNYRVTITATPAECYLSSRRSFDMRDARVEVQTFFFHLPRVADSRAGRHWRHRQLPRRLSVLHRAARRRRGRNRRTALLGQLDDEQHFHQPARRPAGELVVCVLRARGRARLRVPMTLVHARTDPHADVSPTPSRWSIAVVGGAVRTESDGVVEVQFGAAPAWSRFCCTAARTLCAVPQ